MNYADALERQKMLRASQTARARITPGELVDRDAVAEVALHDGVPSRFAGIAKGDLNDPFLYKAADKSVEELMTLNEGHDGLLLYTRQINDAGRVAGAIYTAAIVRSRAAKWLNFADYATMLTDKVAVNVNQEWDVGELATWHTELESVRFCYDLVVVHDLRSQLMTAYQAGELYKLVAARAVRGLFTVLTVQVGQGDALWEYASALKSLTEEQFAIVTNAKVV
jgi:hypothetical protein